MVVAYLTAGDALDDVRRLEDGANQRSLGDAHDAMAVFETFDPPEIPDVDDRVAPTGRQRAVSDGHQQSVAVSSRARARGLRTASPRRAPGDGPGR